MKTLKSGKLFLVQFAPKNATDPKTQWRDAFGCEGSGVVLDWQDKKGIVKDFLGNLGFPSKKLAFTAMKGLRKEHGRTTLYRVIRIVQ